MATEEPRSTEPAKHTIIVDVVSLRQALERIPSAYTTDKDRIAGASAKAAEALFPQIGEIRQYVVTNKLQGEKGSLDSATARVVLDRGRVERERLLSAN